MSWVSSLARIALSLGLPKGVLDRGPSLRGTKFLARAALKAPTGLSSNSSTSSANAPA
ncbi:hypothetical protein NKH19_13570 [Mesorhizobium sp. M1338]|uniref:hypothetical protein n=1 Tax=unclassified Mesorhizobium TaxID=325217 RepID=UPI0033379B0F